MDKITVEPGFAKGEVAVIVDDRYLSLVEAMELAGALVATVNDLLPFYVHSALDHPVTLRAPLRRAGDK